MNHNMIGSVRMEQNVELALLEQSRQIVKTKQILLNDLKGKMKQFKTKVNYYQQIYQLQDSQQRKQQIFRKHEQKHPIHQTQLFTHPSQQKSQEDNLVQLKKQREKFTLLIRKKIVLLNRMNKKVIQKHDGQLLSRLIIEQVQISKMSGIGDHSQTDFFAGEIERLKLKYGSLKGKNMNLIQQANRLRQQQQNFQLQNTKLQQIIQSVQTNIDQLRLQLDKLIQMRKNLKHTLTDQLEKHTKDKVRNIQILNLRQSQQLSQIKSLFNSFFQNCQNVNINKFQ